ncbi:MAG: IMP dehydrogenase [Pyramidobacter sp.]|nr:IMP dehydrogenase [Pyramidobacter sp.]
MSTEKYFASYEGFTFDDVLLEPQYSEVLPAEVRIDSFLTPEIKLNIPICSAAMDTVTEARLAIAVAREGGIGIVHRNNTVEEQATEVDKVKRSEAGVIRDPFFCYPDNPVKDATDLMSHFHISGVPIVDKQMKLVGIITNRDLRFITNYNQPISNVMTSENLITAPEGTTLEDAENILRHCKVEKLPIVDDDGHLKGLITIKDLQKVKDFPFAAKDSVGRLRCGAAVGVGHDVFERVEALVNANVDVIIVDTAHGHSVKVLNTIREIRKMYPDLQLVGGNIATAAAARALIEAGADAVKVGVGPGSICTTRIVAGIGVPQLAAVLNVAAVTKETGRKLIADGGIRYSGDAVKALAAGADSVMIGSLLAGTEESPGEVIIYRGRSYKSYRGMGSLGAMRGSACKDRYFQEGSKDNKLVPEGIEGLAAYKGSAGDVLYQLVGGLRAGMGYIGAASVPDMQKNAHFVKISAASVKENHPHDVVVTKEAPNYWVE